MKAMFSVEESGFDQAGDEGEEKDLLREFVAYIKVRAILPSCLISCYFRYLCA